MSRQKIRHEKLNSYWVMHSIGDNSIYTAEKSVMHVMYVV